MANWFGLGYTYLSSADGMLPETWAEEGPETPVACWLLEALRTTSESQEGRDGRMRPGTS